MNVQNVYNQIKDSLGATWMSELQTETLTLNATTDCDNDQAWSKISEFQPTQGWIQTLDKVHLIENGQTPESNDHLISAELVNAANESLHIRPVNKGRLMVTRFTPGQGETYYVTQTHHQIKHGQHTGTAHYKLYWPQNAEKAVNQPTFGRIIKLEWKEGE